MIVFVAGKVNSAEATAAACNLSARFLTLLLPPDDDKEEAASTTEVGESVVDPRGTLLAVLLGIGVVVVVVDDTFGATVADDGMLL